MNRGESILREAAIRASEQLYRRPALREVAAMGFEAGALGQAAEGGFLSDVAHRSPRLRRLQCAWEKGHAAGLSWTARRLIEQLQRQAEERR